MNKFLAKVRVNEMKSLHIAHIYFKYRSLLVLEVKHRSPFDIFVCYKDLSC